MLYMLMELVSWSFETAWVQIVTSFGLSTQTIEIALVENGYIYCFITVVLATHDFVGKHLPNTFTKFSGY